MILGRGTIASIIPDRENFVFFACGESNRFPITKEREQNEREKLLDILINMDKEAMFVYISGLNIYYPLAERRGTYTQHKLNMEKIVKGRNGRFGFKNYCIFRLGSVTWGDNPNTLINSLKKQIELNPEFEGREVYRYLHTKTELIHWFKMIPEKGKHEMNITGKLTWVPDLVEQIKKGEL